MAALARPTSWVVYMLRCRDRSLYTGITNDLPKRLKAHAAGRASKYTRSRLPVRLAYTEHQATRSLALKREAAIKRMPRQAKLELVATMSERTADGGAGRPMGARRGAARPAQRPS